MDVCANYGRQRTNRRLHSKNPRAVVVERHNEGQKIDERWAVARSRVGCTDTNALRSPPPPANDDAPSERHDIS